MSIRKHIPNTITSMNLLCGAIGVIVALAGRPDQAFLLMIAAACFDFCDGFAARLLGAYSEIGKELDSLADDVSFGVLPAIMLYKTMQDGGCNFWLSLIPLVLAAFSALRLAKFNLDERQHDSFLGLPTPASAMICGSFACYVFCRPESVLAAAAVWIAPCLAIVLSALLVSEIPMFSFKMGKGIAPDPVARMERISLVSIAAIAAVLTVFTGQHWSLVPLAVFTAYIVISLVFLAVKRPECTKPLR